MIVSAVERIHSKRVSGEEINSGDCVSQNRHMCWEFCLKLVQENNISILHLQKYKQYYIYKNLHLQKIHIYNPPLQMVLVLHQQILPMTVTKQLLLTHSGAPPVERLKWPPMFL